MRIVALVDVSVRVEQTATMGVPWSTLYKKGWRIVPCEVCACEISLYPDEYRP